MTVRTTALLLQPPKLTMLSVKVLLSLMETLDSSVLMRLNLIHVVFVP